MKPNLDRFEKFKKYFSRRKPLIQEVVRETTAGGIVFRRRDGQVQILLTQDAKDRWTIAKGHVEDGEVTRETAEREIQEETGLKEMRILDWLGKINFRYRRQNSLVLMTMHVYLVQAKGDTDKLKKEEWMNGIGWFGVPEALDKIEYEDIGKLILLAMKKIRQGNL
ncbi:NUDIX domain-containing protein [Candidatus Saccharibacteria bacterium]|nr:NUDIX domain-containing protein [Candidatus Saccharibacteria bacterium]